MLLELACAGEAGDLFPGISDGSALGRGGQGSTTVVGSAGAGGRPAPGEMLSSGGRGSSGAPPGAGLGGAGGAPLATGSGASSGSGDGATGGSSDAGASAGGSESGPGTAGDAGAGSAFPPERACDAPFGEPELVSGLGLGLPSYGPAPSSDGSMLLFSAIGSSEDIYFATRTSRGSVFSAAALVPGVNGEVTEEGTPFLSADGRELFFFSTRPGPDTVGDRDIWVATASGSGVAFEAPSVVPRVNHDGLDHLPRLSADGLTLMFVSGRDGSEGLSNIWAAERSSKSASFGEPFELPGVNTDAREEGFWLSADGLTLVFASNRASEGSASDMDIFVAVRPDRRSAFEDAQNLAVVNTPGIEIDPALTAGNSELFFASDRSGTMQIYRSARRCP